MNRKRIFSLIIGICALALVLYVYIHTHIQSIDCSSQYGVCDEEVVDALQTVRDKNIVPAYSEIRNILVNHPKVSHFIVQFRDIDSLEVTIVQRKPQVAVTAEGKSGYFLYSHEGILLEQESETQLPIIQLKDASVGTGNQMRFVIEMAYALNQTYNVNSIVIRQGGMEFSVNDSPQIIFPVQGDIDVLLGSLTYILSQLNSRLGEFRIESVDFRFKNPVIRLYE